MTKETLLTCTHPQPAFIKSFSGGQPLRSYSVSLCPQCGEFQVQMTRELAAPGRVTDAVHFRLYDPALVRSLAAALP
jgi:hypothetical protein